MSLHFTYISGSYISFFGFSMNHVPLSTKILKKPQNVGQLLNSQHDSPKVNTYV